MTNTLSINIDPNPIVEEAYCFIGCLYRLRKSYKLLGFNPDFNKKMFGPYIRNKLSRHDGDIREAVDLWCSDPDAAKEKYGHISKWDVSRVTDMSYLFRKRVKFNEDISGWNVSNVTSMRCMFDGAESFNQPLNEWDVSNVNDMGAMFSDANAFNQPIGNWNVSKVTGMEYMFRSATAFNQPLNEWDVSKVTGMEYMFNDATSFNQPICSWNLSNVIDMYPNFINCPIKDEDCPIKYQNKPSF